MPQMGLIKRILKPLIPASLVRRIRLSKDIKRLRDFYFGHQLRSLKPIILATGETHNFTFDLTDTNLLYLAEMVAVATGKPSVEIEGYIR
ncbi:MAG TPA: hypothetical protein VHZ32_15700, partial [Rhizomicrobium sp.]|nr:hypothetical protein [Rhizomicrobium sp.]